MTEINICPVCNITITGPGYPKLHTCTKSNLLNRIEQLQTDSANQKRISATVVKRLLAEKKQLKSENEKLLDEGEALKKRLTGGEDMILLPTVDYEKLQTDHANQKRIPERA